LWRGGDAWCDGKTLIATGHGILAMACVSIIRRSALVGTAAIAAPGLGVAIVLLAYYPAERGTSVPLAFAGNFRFFADRAKRASAL
jgi:hypothetical protein